MSRNVHDAEFGWVRGGRRSGRANGGALSFPWVGCGSDPYWRSTENYLTDHTFWHLQEKNAYSVLRTQNAASSTGIQYPAGKRLSIVCGAAEAEPSTLVVGVEG